jgi:hypothetical protein
MDTDGQRKQPGLLSQGNPLFSDCFSLRSSSFLSVCIRVYPWLKLFRTAWLRISPVFQNVSLLYFRGFVPHFGRSMTRRFLTLCALALTAWLATPCVWGADPTNPAPDFKEVYELLRANLPGATDAALNRAAVAGLVSQFPGKVALIGGAADGTAMMSGEPAWGKAGIIESNVAYLRISRVAAGLAGELAVAGRALTASNKIAGAVLDLRFAGGEDYGAAKEAAGLLTGKKSSRPFAGPLAVLVNNGTPGAAETLAAALRAAGAGLIIGSPTAGDAMTFQEFVLKDGERLLIAAAPVKMDGKTIPSDGLKPDIVMAVNADDERAFWQNPYGTPPDTNLARASTNSFLPFVDRTSEADLVRQRQKDGRPVNLPTPSRPARGPARNNQDESGNDAESASLRAARPPQPMLRDPVLVRAVDLVKGLAVVRGSRP